jgi:hypothetical protein
MLRIFFTLSDPGPVAALVPSACLILPVKISYRAQKINRLVSIPIWRRPDLASRSTLKSEPDAPLGTCRWRPVRQRPTKTGSACPVSIWM